MAKTPNTKLQTLAEANAQLGIVLSDGFRNIGAEIARHPDTARLAQALVKWRRDSEQLIHEMFAKMPGWRR